MLRSVVPLGNCGLHFANDRLDRGSIVCGRDHFGVIAAVSDAHGGAVSEPLGVGIVDRVEVLGRVGGPVELKREHFGSYLLVAGVLFGDGFGCVDVRDVTPLEVGQVGAVSVGVADVDIAVKRGDVVGAVFGGGLQAVADGVPVQFVAHTPSVPTHVPTRKCVSQKHLVAAYA